jgi:hypothetical protein
MRSALQEIQTFTGGRLAGITGKLVVRPEEVSYFDRKEKRKKTSSIWALSLEVEGEGMRKLIANLTENARLFAETRKLLGSGGKVLEVKASHRRSDGMGKWWRLQVRRCRPHDGG